VAYNGHSTPSPREGIAATISQQFTPDIRRAFVPYIPPPVIALSPGHCAPPSASEDELIDGIMERHIGAFRRLARR